MGSNRLCVAAALVVAGVGCSPEQRPAGLGTAGAATAELRSASQPTVTPQESGTTVRFYAVSPVDARVVWAGGNLGTFARTLDGGQTWVSRQMPGAETLQFRDVEGVSKDVAYLLSAGPGTDSRIFKTDDGGNTWTEQIRNTDPNGFWDCFAFWTPRRGILMGDSVEGRFPVHRTTDGQHWVDIGNRLPPAQPGEAAFAASGTCAATQGGHNAWLATGGAPVARILRTTDGGNTWQSSATPIQPQGTPVSGNVSVDFRDARRGIVGGGDVVDSAAPQMNVARSHDGGKSWRLTTPTPFLGAVYGITYTRNHHEDDPDDGDDDDDGGDRALRRVVATGPGGTAWSPDEGKSWTLLPGITNCWAVAFATQRTGWLGCGAGRIFRIDF
jgi:photosystem II stability/assembly factor-like uncharacterized protein